MERKLYLSLATVEELALGPQEKLPELRLLLRMHSQVILDATDEELEEQELYADSPVVLLHQQAGTFKYDTAAAWQEQLSVTVPLDAAGSLYVLDHDSTSCEFISQQYGVCAVSQSKVQMAQYLMRPLARKELVTTSTYQETVGGQLRQGWHAVLTVPELLVSKAPLNALVLIDTYLFGDRGRFVSAGKANLVGLLQALLPASLQLDFHLLLVAANTQVPFDEVTFAAFSQEVEEALKRPYRIRIGLVTRPPGGKERRSITGNYYFCTSQHGFTCFTNSRPDYNNDFIVNGAFEGADLVGYDVPVRSMSTELKTAKKLLVANRLREDAPDSRPDPARRFLGFCDNRLLELV